MSPGCRQSAIGSIDAKKVSNSLAAFAGASRVGELIIQKNCDATPSLATTDQLRGFLQGWGQADPAPSASEPSDYRPVFRHSDDQVALATLKGRSRNPDY